MKNWRIRGSLVSSTLAIVAGSAIFVVFVTNLRSLSVKVAPSNVATATGQNNSVSSQANSTDNTSHVKSDENSTNAGEQGHSTGTLNTAAPSQNPIKSDSATTKADSTNGPSIVGSVDAPSDNNTSDNHAPQPGSPSVASLSLTYINDTNHLYPPYESDPLEIGGWSNDKLIVTARDSNGNPVPNARISIASSNPDQANILWHQITDSKGWEENDNTSNTDGQVSVTIVGDNRPGTPTITASVGNVSASMQITVVPHPTILIRAEKYVLTAGSQEPDTITARVTDKDGNPIPGLVLFPVSGMPDYLNVPVNMELITDKNGEVHFQVTPSSEPELVASVGVGDPRGGGGMQSVELRIDKASN